ncbi:lysozyme inhibitor LprI family protein [Ensifer sp. HO-A22]|uniref:Lysozyme inhibitor LprI family protein n=2 Tax=Ensifer oleiphilus TaxID=2742698 RepID=A0A7Y6Q5V4_9HYPH|nr:lysozyme inhibitor LprI family protein [Ensifer oleiphilus]
MTMRTMLITSALLLAATPALAQEDVDCANATTQADMNICSDKDYEAADAELNTVYKQTVAAMRAKDVELADISADYVGAEEALKKAQRAWIGYRDGQCELAGFEARGGSMEPMLVSGCLAQLTTARTEELKALLEPTEN